MFYILCFIFSIFYFLFSIFYFLFSIFYFLFYFMFYVLYFILYILYIIFYIKSIAIDGYHFENYAGNPLFRNGGGIDVKRINGTYYMLQEGRSGSTLSRR